MHKFDTLFLDRDGVINKKLERRYVKNWQEFEFMPNALLAIKKLSNKFERIIVVTNQQGIGKAIMTIDELSVLHELMKKEIVENGGKIDKIYFCPHLEKENCDCRKPAIGMIKRAIKDFPTLNLKQTFLVGDSPSDIEAGERAGIKTVKVNNQFTLFDWANQL
jgi:histidinol-phosphate phosphatase family protein